MNQAQQADIHQLYQNSVQGVEFELDFIQTTFAQLKKRQPKKMREDFAGTALSATEWVKMGEDHYSVAVDIDPEVVHWGIEHNVARLNVEQQQRMVYLCQDVMQPLDEKFDVIRALNFSYWIFQQRAQLLDYFRLCHQALYDDGILFLDAFGGHEAHQVQEERRDCDGFYYIWDQASYNSLTQEMQCYIHFEFDDGSRINRAFEYCWRVWGPKELQEILADAGFKKSTFYVQLLDKESGEALDEYQPIETTEDYESWIAFLVAEK